MLRPGHLFTEVWLIPDCCGQKVYFMFVPHIMYKRHYIVVT